jgi:hypothetical protein
MDLGNPLFMDYPSRMNTVSDICSRLGRREIATRVGVAKTAISNAVVDGKFPARWFLVLSAMCQEQGIECPKELFSFTEDKAVETPSEPIPEKDAAA